MKQKNSHRVEPNPWALAHEPKAWFLDIELGLRLGHGPWDRDLDLDLDQWDRSELWDLGLGMGQVDLDLGLGPVVWVLGQVMWTKS